jgi:hypothetical protein
MIPRDTFEQINKYVHDRIAPSPFLYAVLSNDLTVATARADGANRAAFDEIVAFVCDQLPLGCRGSAQAVRTWLAKRSG